MPEWKKMYLGKSVSFGQRSTKSIAEQRQSLPIYRLKDSLVKAIKENQVLVVIGETGSGAAFLLSFSFFFFPLRSLSVDGEGFPARLVDLAPLVSPLN